MPVWGGGGGAAETSEALPVGEIVSNATFATMAPANFAPGYEVFVFDLNGGTPFVNNAAQTAWLQQAPGVSQVAGQQLQYADLSADFPLSNAMADVTGLTITFNAPAGNFAVELTVPGIGIVTTTPAAAYVEIMLTDSANTELAQGFGQVATSAYVDPPGMLRAVLPRVGTGAYPITPGNSYTFKARGLYSGATSANIQTAAGTSRPILRAVTC